MEKNFDRGQMYRFGVTLLLVLAFFLAVETVKAVKEYHYIGYDPASKNTITVHGEGESFAIPDTAVISFSVVEEAKTVAEAQQKATDKFNSVKSALLESDIEEKDIKTTGYNAYPKYTYPQQNLPCTQFGCPPQGNAVISGYEVSHSIEVKIRMSDKAGEILGKIGGLNVSNVSGIDFRVDDESKVQAEARAQAITDARDKAEAMATALGVRLVRVVGFTESNYPGPVYYGRTTAMDSAGGAKEASSPVPVQPGQSQVTSSVDVTYEIR